MTLHEYYKPQSNKPQSNNLSNERLQGDKIDDFSKRAR